MRTLLRSEPRPQAFPLNRALPPLETLLTSGGDARLHLDPSSSLNCYGCRPAPRPEALAFSFSTASSISERAFWHASLVRRRLARHDAHDDLVEETRAELTRLLGIEASGTAVVFAPSGTDAMLHALAVARAALGTPLISILAAADETGSGASFAVSGRHFNRATAQGSEVVPGAPIAGLADGVALAAVKLRDAAGALRDAGEIDGEIVAATGAAIASGRRVVLHAMDHSKLGNRSPSDHCLETIEARFGDAIRIVVDACQARLGLARLQRHLGRGRMVLITGSKFFGGPPLSGALLIPPEAAAGADASALPPGLGGYSVASDWPRTWRAARGSLGAGENIGQLLRWSAALEEMSAWFAVPERSRRAALASFAKSVARALSRRPELDLLPSTLAGDEDFPAPTIFPFLVRHNGVELTPAQSGVLHRALNRDLRAFLPGLGAGGRELAALACHIGQPVAVAGTSGPRGALRLSVGARNVTDVVADLDGELERIVAKLGLLLENFVAIAGAA
ncbi:MAG TPA: hypothetical protein VN802_00025 [Stellaceae bacterium]|nr:hypothetical protein [Stellaceae bacterium]